MPYSKGQKTAASIAYAVKTGQLSKSKLQGASLQMYKDMTVEQLHDFASGKIKEKKSSK